MINSELNLKNEVSFIETKIDLWINNLELTNENFVLFTEIRITYHQIKSDFNE
jgi:hypothetical protein